MNKNNQHFNRDYIKKIINEEMPFRREILFSNNGIENFPITKTNSPIEKNSKKNLTNFSKNKNGKIEIREDLLLGIKKATKLTIDMTDESIIIENAFSKILYLKELILKNIIYIKDNAFYGLSTLEKLNLSNNKITILSKDVFNGLDNLKELDISNNQINNIRNNVFIEKINNTFNNSTFNKLKNLEILNLSNNNITTISKNAFDNLKKLEVLDLSSNNINNIDITYLFKELQNLKVLNLSNNNINNINNININKVLNEELNFTVNTSNNKLYIKRKNLSNNDFKIIKNKLSKRNEIINK
jgi:Leucine-rich repeat (LRR) protein